MSKLADIQTKQATFQWPVSCDPAATRTRDRLLRRQMLYPAELPDHLSESLLWNSGCKVTKKKCNSCSYIKDIGIFLDFQYLKMSKK